MAGLEPRSIVGSLSYRLATEADLPVLRDVMDAAISTLQHGFLDRDQIASSRAIMGLDTQLVADGTYFAITSGARIAGCGGWSRRSTLYGSDATPGRDARHLDPATEPARIRAMYTHPDFARMGVGRMILELCEAAARGEGFTALELMGTLSGAPLYRAFGFVEVEHLSDARGGAPVPLIRMRKVLAEGG